MTDEIDILSPQRDAESCIIQPAPVIQISETCRIYHVKTIYPMEFLIILEGPGDIITILNVSLCKLERITQCHIP